MTMPAQAPHESKQDYATPLVFIEAVKARLAVSDFLVDLAADAANAKGLMFYDEARDSLSVDWVRELPAGVHWLNPPYKDITPWARKCAETVAARPDLTICFLVPASVGSNWYRDYVEPANAYTLFLNGRLAFMPDKPTWLYPKDCTLVIYNGWGLRGNAVWDWQ
jgi:phage N-6-adenine-methyltransferase